MAELMRSVRPLHTYPVIKEKSLGFDTLYSDCHSLTSVCRVRKMKRRESGASPE